MELFTVKDVARIIAYRKTPEAIAKVMRQVRHWTNKDLLIPVGRKDTGTGVSRVYDITGVRIAAIILEITRFGVTVDMLEDFDEWIEGVVKLKGWRQAVEGRQDYCLQLGWDPVDEPGRVWVPCLNQGLIVENKGISEIGLKVASEIVINLRAIFERLEV